MENDSDVWKTSKELAEMFKYKDQCSVSRFARNRKISKKILNLKPVYNLKEFETATKDEERKHSYRRITTDTEEDSKGAIIKWLNIEPLTLSELSRRLDRSKETIVRLLDEIHAAGIDITFDDASKQAAISKQPIQFKEPLSIEPFYKNRIKIGCISDTHLGSYQQQLTLLRTAYKIFDQEKVTFIVHAGDVFEGCNLHKDQVFETFVHGFDEALEYAVENYPESKRGIKTYCLAKGSLVLTEAGHKPIDLINVGDRVLGDDGLFHPVTKTMQREGETCTLNVKGNLPIRITSEHPILAKKEEDVSCRLVNTGKRKFCRPSCFGNEGKVLVPQCEKYKSSLNFTPEYIPVGDLQEGDLVSCYFSKEERPFTIDLSKFKFQHIKVDESKVYVLRKTSTEKEIVHRVYERFLVVDEDLSYFFGLYAAEGSFNGRDLNFTFSNKEIDLQQFVARIFTKLGIKYRINLDGSSAVNVSCSSDLHVSMFEELLGKGAGNKKVPSFLFTSPDNIVTAFLRGYLRGDGCRNVLKGGRCYTAATVSSILAQDVAMLAKKVKIISSICKVKQSSKFKANYPSLYSISFTGENLNKLSETTGKLEYLNRLGDHNKSHWFGSYLMRPIRSISKGEKETVYNIEVEGVNSYVVEGIVVHNCITGSHDLSYKKDNGANIVRALCKERTDIVYRGDESASFSISGREWFNINLLHPAGGRSYSLSYKPQKQTEALVSSAFSNIRSYLLDSTNISKDNLKMPMILLTGHFHSMMYLPSYLGVDNFLLGCFQSQTAYLKRKSLFPQVGFLLLTIEFDDKKNITKVIPDFRMMDAYVKDRDY